MDYSSSFQDVSCYGTLPRDSPHRNKDPGGKIFVMMINIYLPLCNMSHSQCGLCSKINIWSINANIKINNENVIYDIKMISCILLPLNSKVLLNMSNIDHNQRC